MKTHEPVTKPKQRKPRAKISHYVVSKRGKPCALFCILDGQRGGVLLPSQAPEEFSRRPRCNAAIARTTKCSEVLRGSLHRDFLIETNANVRELLTDGEFVVNPVKAAKE